MIKIIEGFWPYLKMYLSKASNIGTALDPNILAEYGITRVSFTEIQAGDIPPRVEGIKVHRVDNNSEIVIDVSICYAGDSRIVTTLDLDKIGLKVPIIANNISVKAGLRLVLHPVYKSLPVLGGISISLLDRPTLDWEFSGLSSVLNFILVKQLICDYICDVLDESLVLPKSTRFQLTDDDVSGANLALPQGVLSIVLAEANNIVNTDKHQLGTLA